MTEIAFKYFKVKSFKPINFYDHPPSWIINKQSKDIPFKEFSAAKNVECKHKIMKITETSDKNDIKLSYHLANSAIKTKHSNPLIKDISDDKNL